MNFLKMILWPKGRISKKMNEALIFPFAFLWVLPLFLIKSSILFAIKEQVLSYGWLFSIIPLGLLVAWPMFVAIPAKRLHDRNRHLYPYLLFILSTSLLVSAIAIFFPVHQCAQEIEKCGHFEIFLLVVFFLLLIANALTYYFLFVEINTPGSRPGAERFGTPPIIPDPNPFTKPPHIPWWQKWP